MKPFTKEFYVSNPSPYVRSDYVEVDLSFLGIPDELEDFKLFRKWDDNSEQEIPYQIDKIYGIDSKRRIMTFFSEYTHPSGVDDYSKPSAPFLIKEGKSSDFTTPFTKKENLYVGHYYEKPGEDEPEDGYNRKWYPDRDVNGVKINNNSLEIYFSLVPYPKPASENKIDYSGAFTSVSLKTEAWGGDQEMLSPFDISLPEKKWGQINELVFFPLPWELIWFHRISLLGKKYELVYSNSGLMRAVVVVKSEGLEISYNARPYFEPFTMKSNLYRVIYLYPEASYFLEEIFVIAKDKDGNDISISFRPYFYSYICYPLDWCTTDLRRFEHIPDYFSLWKKSNELSRGFGFAAEAHVRGIEINGNEIRWRLSNSHHKRCLHYFMFHGAFERDVDLFHDIGHYGWYEKVFKPLEVIPLKKIYPAPVEGNSSDH